VSKRIVSEGDRADENEVRRNWLIDGEGASQGTLHFACSITLVYTDCSLSNELHSKTILVHFAFS
jgi:hypothetical protein